MPIGTLRKKIHCHESPSTTAPPTTGPSATARPLRPDQMPIARPRRSAGKAADSSVRLSGMTSAAPRPCTLRAAIRRPLEVARAAPSEPAVKIARPSAKTRRRPKRSPSEAPVSRSAANVSV